MSDFPDPDFPQCLECGGEFYKLDLDSEGVCADCRFGFEGSIEDD